MYLERVIDMKKYAVIGTGHFGSEFARTIDESRNCELALVYSPSSTSEKLALELNCKYTHNIDDVLNDTTIEAVVVASPNYMHYEHVMKCAKAKKHIYCEKPFALNTEQAKEMIEACKQENVTLMVGHIMHFYDGIHMVKDMVENGDMGDILNIHVERTGWEDKKDSVSWKKMQDKSGGHLFHHIHEIDIVQWLLGLPSKVYAVGGNLAHNEAGFGDEDDVILITLSFQSGAFATLQYGSGFRMSNHIIRVNGSKKGALIDFSLAKVTVKSDDGVKEFPLFSDEDSQNSILGLFKKADAGIVYGSPDNRPIAYIKNNLQKEFNMFANVVEGMDIPKEYADLFNGTSAYNSVNIAESCIQSINRNK